MASYPVALRKESVDRNSKRNFASDSAAIVALRKESVDRNFQQAQDITRKIRSLSARRAWIEIFTSPASTKYHGASLSARRAWIEISRKQSGTPSRISRSPQGERG